MEVIGPGHRFEFICGVWQQAQSTAALELRGRVLLDNLLRLRLVTLILGKPCWIGKLYTACIRCA